MESADAGSSDEYRIGREITDVGEDVVAAGPPVVPEMTGRLRLRAVDPTGGDPAMLASWFTRPHLAETWEQEWPESRWRADSAYRLAGDYSRPLIITMDGIEVGYLDLYRPARDEIARLYPADPHDMGFHIATADPALLGQGVISAWLADLAQAIFQTEPRCRRVVLDPAAGNAPIRRALTKHGWIDVGEFDVRPDRRIAMHILGRTPDDVPQL
ncbi:GNAT family N-acetyltransferase [Gordonia sp. HNM0687]|uniref:Lysine N-acyltransferase MbtK n=1 Tax=Gordonia mangrovi TaxID=2665643 RepID=A0A6L7GQU7_9ACTN|nr:GNAT family N-acetyltransferase [Gordonia mangrovi]MXP22002.1 GNAT family N-acetyltransferase [Gordonia mangrovi]UVF80720.1 acetyltransferase [Gordonia mangrovi]